MMNVTLTLVIFVVFIVVVAVMSVRVDGVVDVVIKSVDGVVMCNIAVVISGERLMR